MTKRRRCNIGQAGRCNEHGCEWKKQFGKDCWALQQKAEQKELENPLKDAIDKLNLKEKNEKKHSEFTDNVYSFLKQHPKSLGKKSKKKKKKKNNLVATAISNILERKKSVLSDDELFAKIKVVEPDDWLKKIKTI